MQDLRTSTLIRNGLKHLWDGLNTSDIRSEEKEEYLCHAIARAGRNSQSNWMYYANRSTPEVERRLDAVRGMIEKRLFPWNNLYAWLVHRANVPEADLTPDRIQEHRRKWALKMAAEFKRKGD